MVYWGTCSQRLPRPAHGGQGKASASRTPRNCGRSLLCGHEHGRMRCLLHPNGLCHWTAHLLALGQLRLRAVKVVLHKQAAHKLGDGVAAQWRVQSAAGQPSGGMPPVRPLPTTQPLPFDPTPFKCSAIWPHLYS